MCEVVLFIGVRCSHFRLILLVDLPAATLKMVVLALIRGEPVARV